MKQTLNIWDQETHPIVIGVFIQAIKNNKQTTKKGGVSDIKNFAKNGVRRIPEFRMLK